MGKINKDSKAAKPILACICMVAVLFAYTVPTNAASIKKVKLGSKISAELEDGQSKTYSFKLSKKTKVLLSASVEMAEEDTETTDDTEDADDDSAYEVTDEDAATTDDDGEVYEEATDESSEDEGDFADEDVVDDEEDEAYEEDEADDEPLVASKITVSMNGKKKVFSGWTIGEGATASKTVTLAAGTYKVTVKGTAEEYLDFSMKLQDSSKLATKITVAKKKTLKKGASFTLSVKATGGDLSKLTYTSSNKKIAKVDAKGKVTALKKGTCKITVKMAGLKKTAVCKIKVKK